MSGWRAGLKEQRIALGVAAAALALILAALIAPGLFPPPEPAGPEAPASAPPEPAGAKQAAPSFHIPVPDPKQAAPAQAKQPARHHAATPAPAARPEPGAASRPLPAAQVKPAPPGPASAKPAPTKPARHAAASKAQPPAHRAERRARKAHDRWFVQIGAFRKRSRAEAMLRRIRGKGFDGRIVRKSGGLHAVQAGPRASRDAAETLAHSLKLKAGLKGFLVHDKHR